MTEKNAFEVYVDQWDDKVATREALQAQMKRAVEAAQLPFASQITALLAEESAMKAAIAKSVEDFTKQQKTFKEGTNTYVLSSGRKLKVKFEVKRTITESEVSNARAAFAECNDIPVGVTFDSLLRVKNELAVKEFRKLDVESGAFKAVSHMIVATPAKAAKVELD